MALIGPGAPAVVVGSAAAVSRLREPWLDPRRPAAVVDARTYRATCRQVDRLLARGDYRDLVWAKTAATAITVWLREEIHTGPARHRVTRARQLELWELRIEQLNQRLGLY